MTKNLTVSEIYDEWTHFMSTINFKDSFLDGRSIQFMNEFKEHLEKLVSQRWQPIKTAPENGPFLVCGGTMDTELPYAGVTVWIGDKRCSHGITKDELELSTLDILQTAFDHARRVEGDGE